MNLSETAELLTMISAFNNRTIGEGDVNAWQSVLNDVALDDAREAVRRHFAEQTDWMMPAHVRRIVRDIERERQVSATKWAPGQYGVPKDAAAPEIERGERLTAADVSPRVVELLGQLRAELPDVPRERLFPREAYWDQQQRAFSRQGAAEPPRPNVLELARDECRANGAHDSGLHIAICPGAEPEPEPQYDMVGTHQHRASCHGAIGELLCGFA